MQFRTKTDRRVITVIDSETDQLPVEAVRSLGAADALIEKDIQIARAETHWKADFLEIA